jgi:hypothetical protein
MMETPFCVRGWQALGQWRDLLVSITKDGIQRREIRSGVHPNRLATLIISSLEGALMISRRMESRRPVGGMSKAFCAIRTVPR